MSDRVCVGAVAGAFGVRGELRIKSFCAVPEDIASYNPLSFEDGRETTLRLTGQIKNGLSGRLTGVSNKEAADALRGARLYAPRDRLPRLPDDEFYHADLIGLAVHDTGGTLLGKVAAVHNHGAGDLLELRGPGLKGSVLLPFTRAVVPTVDLDAGRIVADPPEGLF
ncbi:16S rRNA processing protein RimM [Dinoroseobacter shibae DFL 12 = DSM 16493]|jgi:16S rRNA processing protein RimM|uniref:Ribosome maturation factor RimM n=1 Tax=Dinoroseobacter shibae (strain DSM 16493 / NCIMB 14021 / DFL 12) TaxID=398580 RepID=RIMM_DINSH|nr:ribosome maturation factor RimM [Dinoroseobacter shibae]A8LMB6.1 RecName: Full=Ribosome maturation factor RimM [Dinoroseobacter shibae DFL 12 = DSM 16493]ABV92093.1 16S rRNA processing protein RimM [Dinoroseobacter shibae DFL 12 = DSM 16493]URF47055.1 ribosome maturation factor RimM [Dinoroseobacter shibae]URF51366.1 ribosome maturation factor RimM [Dinoroseobacter shibae]